MPRIINDARGQTLVDFRCKTPSDLVEWVKDTYGYDKNEGRERSMNASLTTALRELKRIKS